MTNDTNDTTNISDDIVTTLFTPIESEFPNVNRHYNLIPFELKTASMWLVAADENGLAGGKIPHIILSNGKLQRFSKGMGHEPMPFSIASSFSEAFGYDIGILLTSNDEYGVVDLDAKGIDDIEVYTNRMANFKEVITKFDSYSELSKSEKGYHIIVKTTELIARNSRNYGIEIYSHKDRFMVCTGNKVSIKNNEVFADYQADNIANVNTHEPICYKDNEIKALVESLGLNSSEITIELVEIEPKLSDDEVVNEILSSGIADKYIELMLYSDATNFATTQYPSASEAVLAIICILGRFTESNEQVRRIFRSLPLSNRDKYTKNNYHIDRCLSRIRAELDMTDVDIFINNSVSLYYAKSKEILDKRMRREEELLKKVEDGNDDLVDLSEIEGEYDAKMEEFSELPFPKGVIGELAKFIYARSPHKLKVAAIGGALGIASGIVGSQYRFQGSSLNHFIVIIANSTLGKEGAAKGMNYVSKALASIGGDAFFCFDKISSPQALRTVMTESKYRSIVATFPEFSYLIEQIKDGKDSALSGMYSELLDVFGKNSIDSEYGGAVMANSINNRVSMTAPAFSFVGDCTPNFYDGITEEMCSSGFMSRLLLLHNDNSVKVAADENAHLVKLDKTVIDELSYLVQQVKNKHAAGTFINIGYENEEVRAAAKRIQEYLIIKYNKSKDEAHRQAYGRTWLKIMTVASLFAACNNLGNPTISMEDFQWSQALVMRDVFNIVQKLRDGEIGTSETTCKQRTLALIENLTIKRAYLKDIKMKPYEDLLHLGIVPRHILSSKLQGNSYKIGNMSNTRTLDAILDNMCKDGQLSILSDSNKEFIMASLNRNLRGVFYMFNHPKCHSKLNELIEWHNNKTSLENVAKSKV